MINQTRYFLKSSDKLKSRKTIAQLFEKGNHFSMFPFKVIWLSVEDLETLQTGFAVSSRNFKKATDRNKIKRRMREAYRLQKNDLFAKLKEHQKKLRVFVLYIGKDIPDYTLCEQKFSAILNKLIKQIDEMD